MPNSQWEPGPGEPEPEREDQSDPPTREALAQDLLDLWESNLSVMANDPDFADFMTYLFGLAGAGPATAPRAGDDKGPTHDGTGASASAPAGTPADDAASGPGGGDLDEFRRRLVALEDRLASLETGPQSGSGE